MRLRTASAVCKPTAPGAPRTRLLLRLSLGLLAVVGCRTPLSTRTITVAQLEQAPPVPRLTTERSLVSDAATVRGLCTPLAARLGLLEICTAREWQEFARATTGAGACPDFSRGMLVGVACWAGMPLDGEWPIRLDSVRVHDGGGLLNATFAAGSYLPNGTGWVETAYVEGLHAVLIVDINGAIFYPE